MRSSFIPAKHVTLDVGHAPGAHLLFENDCTSSSVSATGDSTSSSDVDQQERGTNRSRPILESKLGAINEKQTNKTSMPSVGSMKHVRACSKCHFAHKPKKRKPNRNQRLKYLDLQSKLAVMLHDNPSAEIEGVLPAFILSRPGLKNKLMAKVAALLAIGPPFSINVTKLGDDCDLNELDEEDIGLPSNESTGQGPTTSMASSAAGSKKVSSAGSRQSYDDWGLCTEVTGNEDDNILAGGHTGDGRPEQTQLTLFDFSLAGERSNVAKTGATKKTVTRL